MIDNLQAEIVDADRIYQQCKEEIYNRRRCTVQDWGRDIAACIEASKKLHTMERKFRFSFIRFKSFHLEVSKIGSTWTSSAALKQVLL
jgi:hypothetical protein